MRGAALAHVAAGRPRFAADLAAFVRFASVGADPRRRDDVAACAGWLAGRLRRAGLRDAGLAGTPGHPIVHASWRGAPGAPTALVYGHYDVQPAEPLQAWRTPPFEPALEGDDLVGRGACDDKGPVLCHVAAIESYLATGGRLPANVVCVFEGEEEHGSPHLPAFLRAHQRRLAPDVVVVSDTRMRGPGWPAIVDGTRGGCPSRSSCRAAARSCTPASSAAPSPTRSRRSAPWWRSSTTSAAGSPSRVSTTACSP